MNEPQSYYDLFQLEHYGNVLPVDNVAELENGLTEQEKAIAWSEFEYQQRLWEAENE